jgi:hypothetical protein
MSNAEMTDKTEWLENTLRGGFDEVCMQLFEEQYEQNSVYREYCQHLRINKHAVNTPATIPFLPISCFKTHAVVSTASEPAHYFTSSGTGNMQRSKHYLAHLAPYHWSLQRGFEHFFGDPEQYCILALLPNYLENENSSLIYMVKALMDRSTHPLNGFYLDNREELVEHLHELNAKGQRTLLFGVSFALLDLAAEFQLDLPLTTVIETGGMKGRRKEITREAMHQEIRQSIQGIKLCSEYGMTELLSQAYAMDGHHFRCPPWMKVSLREVNDPFKEVRSGRVGGINVIDLANRYSCPFIETQDLGRLSSDGSSFEVLGRFDHSDVRGCNMLVE